MSVTKRKIESDEGEKQAKHVKKVKTEEKPFKKNFLKKDLQKDKVGFTENNEITKQVKKIQSKGINGKPKSKSINQNGKSTTKGSSTGILKIFENNKSNKGVDGAGDKPPNWKEIKKQQKELKVKRKQAKSLFEVITQAKQISEKLRKKNLEGGKEERDKLVAELHNLLGGQGNYVKFVLSHDMGRVVQYLLKFGNQKIRDDIAKELIPSTVLMLQSKYGKFCIKRLFKYGNAEIRSQSIRACYGNAVKLTSHSVSAPVFEYAYATWAQPIEKVHLIQEFFGDMYKKVKDDSIKHLRDVYKHSPEMKKAAIEATKANLSRVLNKNLLDSGLVQSVLSQYVTECSEADKTELLTQLASHVVILSNSKDGAKVVMLCIWNGTNKDRKIAMKAIKEHVIELCKHEHGHAAIIALLDSVDDTVLLNKMILTDILSNALDLAKDEWGRKVLLWLVAPSNSNYFHPTFVSELGKGRESSTCKKSPEIRQKEILSYSTNLLLINLTTNAKLWLENASISVVALTILKSGNEGLLSAAFESVAKVVVDPEWKIKEEDKEILGIEHAGLHMTLKKLIQNDKNLQENSSVTFSKTLLSFLGDDLLKIWTKLNRGCFVLVAIIENAPEDIKEQLKEKLNTFSKTLKKQTYAGAKILLQKLQ